jgi:hypothetical protein
MNMGMQHGQRHAAWTWACSPSAYSMDSIDMVIQSGKGHAVWKWTCSINMEMDKDKIWTYCRLLLDWQGQQTTLFSKFLHKS